MAVVTISRTIGSLGDLIAEGVATRLGYRLVRRADLIQIARRVGDAEHGWERSPELSERSPSFWERLNDDRTRAAGVLRRAVTDLAAEDSVVIVGHGAGQLLRGLGNVLRVQVVAPPAVQIQRVMRSGYEDTPGPLREEQARRIVRQQESDAAGYLRYLFNINWVESHHWDLVVNTGRFSVPQAVDVIAGTIERGDVAATPEDKRHLADLVVGSRIEVALMANPNLWVSHLMVTVSNGCAKLEGEVMSDEERELAEQLSQTLEGVSAVENVIRVQPPPLTAL